MLFTWRQLGIEGLAMKHRSIAANKKAAIT